MTDAITEKEAKAMLKSDLVDAFISLESKVAGHEYKVSILKRDHQIKIDDLNYQANSNYEIKQESDARISHLISDINIMYPMMFGEVVDFYKDNDIPSNQTARLIKHIHENLCFIRD